jgi:hypothetical protein
MIAKIAIRNKVAQIKVNDGTLTKNEIVVKINKKPSNKSRGGEAN